MTHFTAMLKMLTKDSLMDGQIFVPNTIRLMGIKSVLSGSKSHFVSLKGM